MKFNFLICRCKKVPLKWKWPIMRNKEMNHPLYTRLKDYLILFKSKNAKTLQDFIKEKEMT